MTDAPNPAASPFTAFGVFASLFDEGRHLTFLNLRHEPQDNVAALMAIVQAAAPSLEADIATLLSPAHGWRPQVVGASAAIAIGVASEPTIRALWAALEEPNWASPQLAAAVFLLDPDFDARARRRIEALCFVDPLHWKRDHPDTSLASRPDGKQLAAMVALRRQGGVSDWLELLVARPEVRAVLDTDHDQAGEIALRWLARARRWLSPTT